MSHGTIQESQARVGGKYITFSLDDENYGIQITKIREIIGMMSITPVPQTPDFVLGVINLRGRVIPVIDLRRRFELSAADSTDRTPIIVVELTTEGAQTQIGVMVDSVSEVFQADNDSISETPSFGVDIDTAFILGIAEQGGWLYTLLDIEQVLTDQAITALCEDTDTN